MIGGGHTAIDNAVQSKRLGADDVTICYRRRPEETGATWHDQEVAQTSGVKIKHWVRPVRLHGANCQVGSIELGYTRLDESGRLAGTGNTATLPADTVFMAIPSAGKVIHHFFEGRWESRLGGLSVGPTGNSAS